MKIVTHLWKLTAAAALAAALALCSPSEHSSGPPQARISARLLATGEAAVTVTIPPRHHAYLNSGDSGSLIPVKFDWGAAAAAVEPTESPRGERDETVKALVLRGEGQFRFAIRDSAIRPGQAFRVQSQICNEERGVCYRPVWQDVVLQSP